MKKVVEARLIYTLCITVKKEYPWLLEVEIRHAQLELGHLSCLCTKDMLSPSRNARFLVRCPRKHLLQQTKTLMTQFLHTEQSDYAWPLTDERQDVML